MRAVDDAAPGAASDAPAEAAAASGAAEASPAAGCDDVALPESQPMGSPDAAPPLYVLSYPPFAVGRLPHPKLLAQQLGACVALFAFAFLYIGAAWDPHTRLRSLQVAVLSCDAGVPPALAAALPAALSAAPPLGAQLLAAALFAPASPAAGLLGWHAFNCAAAAGAPCAAAADACRGELVTAVERGEVWAALFVPRSFTRDVLSNAPALGLNATQARMEHIYGAGRSSSTYTFIKALVAAATAGMSTALAQSVAAQAALRASMSTGFFITPLVLTDTNLHPVVHFGQAFASYVLCVLLWMGSAFTVSLLYQFKTRAEADALATGRLIPTREALRALAAKALFAVAICFLQATALVAVILCLGGYRAPGATARHHGCQWAHSPGYAIAYGSYMAWSFVSINALCLHTLGQERFTSLTTLLLIAQLTSAGAFFGETLSNRFFLLGRGLPFYYGVRTFRTVFFGGQENWLAFNWMVPTVWNVGCFAAYAAFTVARLQRRVLAGVQPLQALSPLTGVVLA